MLTIDIKNRLKELNMNKNQFAKQCKIGYPAACALYDGTTSRIHFETLENICKTLNCTPNDIMVSDDEQMQRLLDSYTSEKR